MNPLMNVGVHFPRKNTQIFSGFFEWEARVLPSSHPVSPWYELSAVFTALRKKDDISYFLAFDFSVPGTW